MKDPFITLPYWLAIFEIKRNPEDFKPDAISTIKKKLAKFKKTKKYKDSL